jgi:hypothetical protein
MAVIKMHDITLMVFHFSSLFLSYLDSLSYVGGFRVFEVLDPNRTIVNGSIRHGSGNSGASGPTFNPQ